MKTNYYGSLKKKYISMVIFVTLFPLLISYTIFINDKIKDYQQNIKETLKLVAIQLSSTLFIQDELALKQNTGRIQAYVEEQVERLEPVDIIVIADEEGRKYSHLDRRQIGDIFIGEDKTEVLENGTSYYSLKEGSQGLTLRYFMPIYKNSKQVGFVMVGKYQTQILEFRSDMVKQYIMLLILVSIGGVIGATYFAFKLKKTILDMEPEEIADLYLQKTSILNSVQEGIILLDRYGRIQDINQKGREIFNEISDKALLQALKKYIYTRQHIRMQEFIIDGQKLAISLSSIIQDKRYLGAVITIMDTEELHEVAKQIIGIEEVNKHLRATVHEFKNNMHVLLGLLQLEEYDEAKSYISKIEQVKMYRVEQFSILQDPYLRAMLAGRAIMAEEKRVKMVLNSSSYVMEKHGIIDEEDIIIILGNLIENAIEACSIVESRNKKVEIYLNETPKVFEIEVKDTGAPISKSIENSLFELGISSKGENRGTGLYSVKNRVEVYKGTIQVIKKQDEKTFRVILMK